MKAWLQGDISNYDYLMRLNTLAHRSEKDLAQYPVFPWILADYTSNELHLDDPSTFRDLSKPIGMLSEVQATYFKERYEDMPDPKYHYGTHYSAPAFICYYLVREVPGLTLKLQNGKFDHADRAFDSLSACWESVNTNQSDIKELIPHFFQPERARFLQNHLDLSLGRKQTGDALHHVALPPWAENHEDFVKKHRDALESDYVSSHLHEWIDLIFGYKQLGEEAILAGNVFHPMTYAGHINLEEIESLEERRAVEAQIAEFGQTPKQLLASPHPKRGSKYEAPETPQSASEVPHGEEEHGKTMPRGAWGPVKDLLRVLDVRLHQDAVTGLCLLDNAKPPGTIVTTARDSTLSLFDLKTEKQTACITLGHGGLLSCAVAGQSIIAGCEDSYIYEVSPRDIEFNSNRVCGHGGAVTGLKVSGNQLASVSLDGYLKLWDYGMGGISRTPVKEYSDTEMDQSEPIHFLDVDSSFHTLVTGGKESDRILVWDLRASRLIERIQTGGGGVSALTFCREWQQVVCADESMVRIFDLRKMDQPLQLLDMMGVSCMATDDQHMLIGDAAGRLNTLNCEEVYGVVQRVTVEHGPGKAVTQIVVDINSEAMTGDQDARRAFSATALGTVQVWDCGRA